MKRLARLQSARSWLNEYAGKNVLRGYCKHFGVDWRCAATELAMIGVSLDPEYLQKRERSEAELAMARKRKKRNSQLNEVSGSWHGHTDPFAAYVAGDYEALHALECERDGIEPLTGMPLAKMNDPA